MSKKPIALIDMDGTIADYTGQFIYDLKSISAESEIELIDSFGTDLGKLCSIDIFEKRRHIITSQNGWWRNLDPIEENLNFAHHIYEMGFEIHILTKGPRSKPFAWSEKVEWINRHCNPRFPSKMNIVTDKSLFYGKILFDDHVPYVKDWLQNRPRGMAILPLDDSNKDFSHNQAIHLKDNLSNFNDTLEKIKKFKNNLLD